MVIINSNNSSAMSARVLGESTQALQKSLGRLSSGSKLNSPMDNAAGAAISLTFDAHLNFKNCRPHESTSLCWDQRIHEQI